MAVQLVVNKDEKTVKIDVPSRAIALIIPVPDKLSDCPMSSSGKTRLLASVNERLPQVDALGFFGTRINLNLMSYPKAK